MASGTAMVIANSQETNVIRRIVAGEELGSFFVPREKKMHARDRWIAFGSLLQGRVFVDAGAANALLNKGKSLLPSGITGLEGEFERGAVVAVMDDAKQEIARGISNYSSSEILKIKGMKSSQIKEILGEKDYDEIIHRNNLWVEH
jgi:glutamate 5-kinase